jgi:hypothetical protein
VTLQLSGVAEWPILAFLIIGLILLFVAEVGLGNCPTVC